MGAQIASRQVNFKCNDMGKYFTVEELSRSDVARRRGIRNVPGMAERDNMERLIERVLDPLRETYGKPIRVNSGYRCPELNRAVGGSRTSDHMTGRAADIEGTPATPDENRKLYEILRGMDFDQLIDEKGMSWVHVSYRSEAENRREVLKL